MNLQRIWFKYKQLLLALATMEGVASVCSPTSLTVLTTVSDSISLIPNSGAGNTQILAVGGYLTTTPDAACTATYSILDNAGAAVTGSWLSFDGSYNLQVNTAVRDSKQIKIRVNYNSADFDTNVFTVTVKCPDLTQTTVTTPVVKEVPSSTAASKVDAVLGTAYASTTSTHSQCVISGYTLKESDGTTAYSGSATWLAITSAGNVQVDSNTIGSHAIKVAFTYAGTSYTSSAFTVQVKCPTLSVTTLTTPFTRDLSNTALTETLIATGYVSGSSTSHSSCAVTYQVVKADNSALGGTSLYTDASGNLKLDRQVIRADTGLKIKYTQNAVDAYTSSFDVTVACPALTTATPSATYTYTVPNTATGTTTDVLTVSNYVNNPSTMSACALTFSLVLASDGTTAVTGTWLTVDSSGTVKVDTNTLGDKTVKVKYQQGAAAAVLSGQFQVKVQCPTLTTATIPTTVTKYVPSSTASSKETAVIGTSYVSTSSSHAVCALSNFKVYQGGALYTGSWIAVGSDGSIQVDTNTIQSLATVKIEYTYQAVQAFSSEFTLEVKCAALTITQPGSAYTRDLSNTALTETIISTGYISGSSNTHPACAITYQVVKSDNSALGGTWLYTDASGNLKVDRQVLGKETGLKIKYTQNAVDAYTNGFDVTVGCPALTTATPSATYAYTVPSTAAASSSQVLTMSAYLANPSTVAACGLTFSLVEASDGTTAVTGTWVTIDSTGTVKVDTNTLGDKDIKVKYVQAGISSAAGTATTATSGAFKVKVTCPALTQTNVATPITKYVPATTAASHVDVVAGSAYVTSSTSQSSCSLAGYTIKDMSSGTAAAYTASWLSVAADGKVTVDSNTVASLAIRVDYTYGGTAYNTNTFTVEVKCSAMTITQPTASFTRDLSNTALTETIIATGYVTSTSQTHSACAVTYSILKSDGTALGGSWLYTDASGNVQLDRQVLGTQTGLKIQYTQNGVNAQSNAFSVTVGCPALTTASPNALYSYTIPNTAAASPTTVITMSAYLTNPSTMPACAVTLSLVEASDGTTAVTGTWLTIDASGTIKVDTNVLGDKTVKVKHVQSASSITALSTQFQVKVVCPTLVQTAVTASTTRTVPNTATASNTQIIAGTSYVTTTSTATVCALTYQLWQSGAAMTGTWLTIDLSGNIAVDENTPGTQSGVTVKMTYASVTYTSSAFSVTVQCPTFTHLNPTGQASLTQTVPNAAAGSPTQILTQSQYVTTASTATGCALSTHVIIDTSTSAAITGTWLTVDASGNIKVDTNTRGKKTIKMRFTQAGTVYTSTLTFDVIVKCPALTVPAFTPATPYNYLFTVGAAATQVVAGTAYVTSSSTSAQCPLTYSIYDVTTSAVYSGSFVTLDASGNLKVDTNTKASVTIKLQYHYYNSNTDPLTITNSQTAQFIVTVGCPTFVFTTITPTTYTYDIPNTAAAAATVVKAATAYINTATITCAVTYKLVEKPSNLQITGTWLTVTTAGDVQVDTNTKGSKTFVVDATYDGSTFQSTQITVTVKCPALTTATLSPNVYTYTVPNTAAASTTKIITGSTGYVSNPSTNSQCTVTFQIFLKGTSTLLTGTWLTVDAVGDLYLDTNVRDEKEVYVKYTWAYDASTTNTPDFKVTCQCPALTTPTLNAQYSHYFTANGGTTLATSFVGTDYASTSTTLTTQCPLTYSFVDAGTLIAYVGTWLTFTAATGTIQVNTDILGSKDIIMKYTYYTTPLATTTQQTASTKIKVVCPPLVLGALSATTYTFTVPNTYEGLPYEFVSNSYIPVSATCTKTFRVMSGATGTFYTGTWVTASSTGAFQVNRNFWGSERVFIRVTYDGNTYDSPAATVTGSCPSLTTGTITGSPFSYTIPNAATFPTFTTIITGTTYVSTTSTAASCAITYQLIKTASTFGISSGANFVKVATNGDISVDKNTRGSETVYIRYTYSDTAADTAPFTVTVECPTLTTNHAALVTPAVEIVPVVLAASKKQIITNTYVTNPSTNSQCLLTYAILDGTTSNPMQPLGGTWLAIDSNGHISVDVNIPSIKTIKVRYVHIGVTTDIPSGAAITITVNCPAIALTQPSATYTYTVPDVSSTQTVLTRNQYIADYPLNCPIVYELVDSATNDALTAPTYTWLQLSATGVLTVDINQWDQKAVKIKYTDVYPSNTVAYTNAFTVTVNCPAVTTNALPTTSFTYVVPYPRNDVPELIIKNQKPVHTLTPYVNTASLSSKCQITYQITDTSNVAYPGALMSLDSAGNVRLYIHTKFSGTYKIRYTHATYQMVTADTATFTIGITCSPLVLHASFVASVPSKTYNVPYTKLGIFEDVFGMNFTNTVSCPITFELVYNDHSAIPYPTSTLFVFNSLNQLQMSITDPGVYQVKLKITYDGIVNLSNMFTLTTVCPAHSTLAVNFPSNIWAITIPITLQNRQILYGNETWKKPNACPMSFDLVRVNDSSVVTGSWLKVNEYGEISVDVNSPGYEEVKLKYTYDSAIYYTASFKVNVSCTSFIAPTFLYQITRLYYRYENTFGRSNEVVRPYSTELANYIDIEKCLYCWTNRKTKFTLQSDQTKTYTGNQLAVANNMDLVIKTDVAFNTPTYLDITSDSAYCRTYFGPQRVKLNIEVCGDETLTVSEPLDALQFNATFSKDSNFKISNITSAFVSSSATCTVSSWQLWSSPIYPVNVTGNVVWTNFIKIDPKTGEMTVNHNDIPGTKQSVVYPMWVVAETYGKKIGVKKVNMNFTLPETNKAPRFATTPEILKVKIYQSEQTGNLATDMQRIELPAVVDPEGVDRVIIFTKLLEEAPCGCVQIRSEEFGSTGKVFFQVDRARIKAADALVYNASVDLTDDKFKDSNVRNYYLVFLEIEFVPVQLQVNSATGQILQLQTNGSSSVTNNATSNFSGVVITNQTIMATNQQILEAQQVENRILPGTSQSPTGTNLGQYQLIPTATQFFPQTPSPETSKAFQNLDDGSVKITQFYGDGTTRAVTYLTNGTVSTKITNPDNSTETVISNLDGITTVSTRELSGKNMTVVYRLDGSFSTQIEQPTDTAGTPGKINTQILTDSLGAYASLKTLPNGTQITVLRDPNGLTEVFYGDQTGTFIKNVTGQAQQEGPPAATVPADSKIVESVTNKDGSITMLYTSVSGEQASLTTYKDGSKKTVVRNKDGELVTTTVRLDGSTTTLVKKGDGSSVEYMVQNDGVRLVTRIDPDGSSVEEKEFKNGTTMVTKRGKNGEIVEAKLEKTKPKAVGNGKSSLAFIPTQEPFEEWKQRSDFEPTVKIPNLLNLKETVTEISDGSLLISGQMDNNRTKTIKTRAEVEDKIIEFQKNILDLKNAGVFDREDGNKTAEPVQIGIEQVTPDSRVILKFQPRLFQNPFETEKGENSTISEGPTFARSMIALSELNVTRDVLEFRYRLRNDEIEQERIKYDLTIISWTETGMELKVDFVDPLAVSYGNMFDLCYIKIKNPYLFVSKESGVRLSSDYESLNEAFPKLVSKDIDYRQIDSLAKQCFYVFLAFILLFLVMKFLLLGSISDIWVLHFACQMVLYLHIYQIYMPANAITFVIEFKKLIEFDWLNPVKYYTWSQDQKFRLSDWLMGIERLPFDNDDQTYSIIDELQIYVFAVLIYLFIYFTTLALRYIFFCSRKLRHFFRDHAEAMNKKVLYNWVIRLICVIYVQLCITNFHQLRLWGKGSPYQGPTAKVFTVFICMLQAFILAWSLLFLVRGHRFLYNPGIFPRISNLYEGIHLYKDKRNIYYTPVFMLRRLCFVLIPLIFQNWQWCQLQLLIWLNLGYFAWYVNLKPHEERSRVRLEIFNESVILVVIYHMLPFSEMAMDSKIMYTMGHSYIAFVLFLVCGNFSFIILKEVDRQHRRRQLIIRQEKFKQLLIQRKRNEIVLSIHNQQELLKQKLAEQDPDLVKPRMQHLTNLPKFYAKKVMLKHIGLEKIKEENVEDFDNEINEEIFKELGTFGDIVQKSRKQLLEGFCCPDDKEPIKFDHLHIEIPELPVPMEPFKISFAESSKQRWTAYEMKLKKLEEETEKAIAQKLESKAAEQAEQKPEPIRSPVNPSQSKEKFNFFGTPKPNLTSSSKKEGSVQAVAPVKKIDMEKTGQEEIYKLQNELRSSRSSVIEVNNDFKEDFGRDTREAFHMGNTGMKMITKDPSEVKGADEESYDDSKMRRFLPPIDQNEQAKVIDMLKTGMSGFSKDSDHLRVDSKETERRTVKIPGKTVSEQNSQPQSALKNPKEQGNPINIEDLEAGEGQSKGNKRISVPGPTAVVTKAPKTMESFQKSSGKQNKIGLKLPIQQAAPTTKSVANTRQQALQQLEELGDQLNSDDDSSVHDLDEVLQNYEEQSEVNSKFSKNKFNKQ